MKNNKPTGEDKAQTAAPTKKKNKATTNHEPAVANKYTSTVKNTAHESDTSNQAKTTKNNLEPGF